MTPLEKDIYKTLNLLVMLSHSRKQLFPNLSEEEKATIRVSKQIIFDAGLTIPEFTSTLSLLNTKGYVWHVVFFDDHIRSEINEFMNGSQYDTLLEQLRTLDTPDFSNKFKASIKQDFEKILPLGIEIDEKIVEEDHLMFSQAFVEGRQMYKKIRDDEVTLIVLMPFRDIKRPLEKMQSGISFDEIQDSNIWYDAEKFEFHIGAEKIPTYYGKPNIEHYVLLKLYDYLKDGVIWYEEIDSFKPRAIKDALLKFVKKNSKLKEIFTIHSDRLEFKKEAFE